MGQLSLQLLHEVVVSGGSVTTMTTGTFTALDALTVYEFTVGIKTSTTGAKFNLFFSDGTSSNYRAGYVRSNNTANYDSITDGPNAWDDMCFASGFIAVNKAGQTPVIYFSAAQHNGTSSKQYGKTSAIYQTTLSSITEFQVVADTASKIENGSYIRIWESVQS